MTAPRVENYGDSDVESFGDYYSRWPAHLSNFPSCVVENWVHRHWDDFEYYWLGRNIEQFRFELGGYTNPAIMEIGHVGDWLETMDYWGDELFRDDLRRDTWLAKFMLEHGSTPSPIIVATNVAGFEHPSSGRMQPLQLIEGHMRLAYLRGMIRHQHPALQPLHQVWNVTLPKSSFNPIPNLTRDLDVP